MPISPLLLRQTCFAVEKTAELQIRHVIEQAKHIKETVFKFTCHVPNVGELKKSNCLFLQSCYLFISGSEQCQFLCRIK